MVAITTCPTPQTTRSAPGVSWLQLVPARRGETDPRHTRHGAGRLLTLLAGAVLVLAVGYLLNAPAVDAGPGIPVQEQVHVVAPGETMWSIAGEVAPAGEAATYVERLVEVNDSSTVRPGQVLHLPIP